MKRRLVLVLALALSAPTSAPSAVPTNVSMVQLIANPERYDGRLVRVIGFLYLGRESNGLYLNAEDYQHGIDENAVGIEVNPQIRRDSEKLELNYVIVEGTFSTKHLGYFPYPNGEILNVARADLWSELKYPRVQKYRDLWQKKPN